MLEEAPHRSRWTAIEGFGFAMGPFRMSDLAGNDISWHIRKRHYAEHPKMRHMRIADRICELGRFGQKTGMGWYRYEAGKRDAIPDPVVDAIIDEERKALGMNARRLPDAEIVDRLLYALVNEGAKILEEGIALRASDLDVVYLTGYGCPLQRGGPMFHASQVGLGGLTIGRATYQPGWRWSVHVGAATGASWCRVEHVGLVVSGVATAAFEDGRVTELKPGMLFHIPAQPHDSWVVGTDP
jgi:3-hydroxyacyl-CoA dehydrogenase